MTMQLIQRTTVGSGGATSIDFTSIPATYTDLAIVVSGRGDRTGFSYSDTLIKLNGATTNFTHRALYGTGSGSGLSWSSSAGYVGFVTSPNSTANTFGNVSIYIPNYAGSTAKSISTDSVTETNASGAQQGIYATLWNVTDPISSISLYLDAGRSWVQYSTATLYGILKGSDGVTTVS